MSKPTATRESALQTRESYHPRLDMAMRWAAERNCEDCSTAPGWNWEDCTLLTDIGDRYNAIEEAFKAAINVPDRTAMELHARCKDLENTNADLRKQLRELRKAA